MKIHDIFTSDAAVGQLIGRSAVRVRRPIKEGLKIRPSRGAWVILQALGAIHVLRDNFLQFGFRKGRVANRIHQQIQAAGKIFRKELGIDLDRLQVCAGVERRPGLRRYDVVNAAH